MTNNDILRRVRYLYHLSDKQVIKLFLDAGLEVTTDQVETWLKRDDDPEFQNLTDKKLAYFLNGLIIRNRGKRDGPPPVAESKLSNNIIFRKLKIALNYQSGDILECLKLADYRLSEHELSAFFRKPEHKHYRKCMDQVLRNFLAGVQHRFNNEKP